MVCLCSHSYFTIIENSAVTSSLYSNISQKIYLFIKIKLLHSVQKKNHPLFPSVSSSFIFIIKLTFTSNIENTLN